MADGDWSGTNIKTNDSYYVSTKFVFTVIDSNTIKMDVYETETGKEFENNVIFYL